MFNLIKTTLFQPTVTKINPYTQKNLQQKLHTLTQLILNSKNKQFDQWMQLQSQINLHYTLQQMYERACSNNDNNNNKSNNNNSNNNSNSSNNNQQIKPKYPITQQQLALIFQFYMVLINNSNDQLLLCKLVSDQFVIQLCTISRITSQITRQQLQPYRINLIKSYLWRVNHQILKYMVVQDRFKVFEQCVLIHEGKAGTVEQATINNAILNLLKKIDQLRFLWQSIWINNNSLKRLLTGTFNRVIKQLNQQYNQDIQQQILILNQIHFSTNKQQIIGQFNQYSREYLEEILREIIKTKEIDINKYVRMISQVLGLFKVYGYSKGIIEEVMGSLKDLFEIIDIFVVNKNESENDNMEEINSVQNKIIGYNNETKDRKLLCQVIFILGKVIDSPYSHLSQRIARHPQHHQCPQQQQKLLSIKKQLLHQYSRILTYLTSQINNQLSLSQIQPKNQPKFIFLKTSILIFTLKCIFLSIFKIKLTFKQQKNNKIKQQCPIIKEIQHKVLQFFYVYLLKVQKLMKNNMLWNQIIRWYEDSSIKVMENLLDLPDNLQASQPSNQTQVIMLGLEYLKTYRFMIVPVTTLKPKHIKQQKSYHQQFNSPGLSFQPGTILQQTTQQYSTVCACILNHNLQQIPVIIIQDKQCFIIAMKNQNNETSILINIKFKDIDNFIYGNNAKNLNDTAHANNNEDPKFLRINLKGVQQLNMQFVNPKIVGNAFKNYLIKSKDMCRQRQLSFFNNWLKDYLGDCSKSILMLQGQHQNLIQPKQQQKQQKQQKQEKVEIKMQEEQAQEQQQINIQKQEQVSQKQQYKMSEQQQSQSQQKSKHQQQT